ncbi:MAG: DUF2125 domain-containing protein [Rhodospirillales bacterium]|nr:DUF2125 domain-containing protein [Rhodospirillales bacterium]
MSRHLKPLATAAGIIALSVLYGFYWNYLSGQIRTGVEQWAAERQADGYTVAYTGLRIGGFPFRLDAVMTDPEMSALGKDGSWSWRGPALLMRVRPWRPSKVKVLAAGLHMVRAEKGARSVELFIDARDLWMTLRFKDRAMLSVRDLLVKDGTDRDVIKIAAADVVVKRPDKADSVFDVVANVLGVTYGVEPVRGLGLNSKQLGLHALVMGTFPDVPARQSLNAETMVQWRDSGGAVEFSRLDIRHGPLALSGDGTMALDEGLQPIGSFAIRVGGYDDVLDSLAAAGVIKARPAAMVKAALSVLARTQTSDGGPEIKVPLSLQDRRVYVGPLAVGKVPNLRWP